MGEHKEYRNIGNIECFGEYGETELKCLLYPFPTKEEKEDAIEMVDSPTIVTQAEAEIWITQRKSNNVGLRNKINMKDASDVRTLFGYGKQTVHYHFDKPAVCKTFEFGWLKNLDCNPDDSMEIDKKEISRLRSKM